MRGPRWLQALFRHAPRVRMGPRRWPWLVAAVALVGGGLATTLVRPSRAPLPRPPGGPVTACDSVPAYRDGKVQALCDPQARGFTMIPVANDWLPRLFSEAPGKPQRIRREVLDMANERPGRVTAPQARRDRHFELYGVFPSLDVIGRRLLDEERHRCHDGVDDAALASGVEGAPATAAVQAHLVCEGILTRHEPGVWDGATRAALGVYQRKHMVAGWPRLDAETRALLLTDSRELDFRALLRVLRERVADTTGLIEDGSAAGRSRPILGRTLDSADLRLGFARAAHTKVRGQPAEDLIGQATEAAARALGWHSPSHARAWFLGHVRPGPQTGRVRFVLPAAVALPLPPLPDYHRSPTLDLAVEIDRGDVWLSPPRRRKDPGRRPALVLYARHEGREIALARWPTTTGGWQPFEEPDGSLTLRHSQSRVGEALWTEVLAGPTWYPPEGIPIGSLVDETDDGVRVRQEVIGPGYRSAYGLVAIIHREPRDREGEPLDHGIRTHGSPSYLSIARGVSHGCHRLYNHLAIRLGSFLLAHRTHVRHGAPRTRYTRQVEWEGEEVVIEAEHRGYRYELDPPVPVRVLRGHVHGNRAAVARAIPLAPPPAWRQPPLAEALSPPPTAARRPPPQR